jgi:hypothetical protein
MTALHNFTRYSTVYFIGHFSILRAKQALISPIEVLHLVVLCCITCSKLNCFSNRTSQRTHSLKDKNCFFGLASISQPPSRRLSQTWQPGNYCNQGSHSLTRRYYKHDNCQVAKLPSFHFLTIMSLLKAATSGSLSAFPVKCKSIHPSKTGTSDVLRATRHLCAHCITVQGPEKCCNLEAVLNRCRPNGAESLN